MLDRVTIRVADLDASARFYSTVLGRAPAGAGILVWGDFSIVQADAERPRTRCLHVAFAALSRADVDSFWRAGLDAGYRSDGEPGPRPHYHPDYYGGFLLDPDGNSVEAATGHRGGGGGPSIDHLWLGVADLAAARRFYEAIAPVLGLRVTDSLSGHVVVARGDRHLVLVADGRAPTENVELVFAAPDGAAVARFHDLAGAAAARDPGGNTVEAVDRNRR